MKSKRSQVATLLLCPGFSYTRHEQIDSIIWIILFIFLGGLGVRPQPLLGLPCRRPRRSVHLPGADSTQRCQPDDRVRLRSLYTRTASQAGLAQTAEILSRDIVFNCDPQPVLRVAFVWLTEPSRQRLDRQMVMHVIETRHIKSALVEWLWF